MRTAFPGKLFIAILLLAMAGCSGDPVEELVFRKTLEYQLGDRCGENNEACIEAVAEQIAECMRQSDWKRYLDRHENEQELQRFIGRFFPCFKDANGNELFS